MSRRDELLEIALEAMDEAGVRGTSMRELARRAGVDVRSMYYHFASKHDLLKALFEKAGMLALLLEPVPVEILETLKSLPPPQALLVIIEGNLQALHDGSAYWRLIHIEVLHGDEAAKAVGKEMWSRWGEQLAALLTAAGLAESKDAGPLMRLIRSLLWGVFNESQLTGELADNVNRHARAVEIVAGLGQDSERLTRAQ